MPYPYHQPPEQTGDYEFCFSNSFSTIAHKTVGAVLLGLRGCIAP